MPWKLPDLRAAGALWDKAKGQVGAVAANATATEYPVEPAMPVRQIHRHIYTTATETRGVYTLSDATWSNQSAGTQAHIVDLAAAAWEALSGRDVKIRIGKRPLNPWGWAERYAAAAPRPAGEKGSMLIEHLYAAGERQLDINLIRGVVTVDVRLTGAKDGRRGDDWAEQEQDVLSQLSNDSLCGAPAEPGTVDVLIHSALAPGHPLPPPAPGVTLRYDDMAGFTEEVDWYAPVLARAVRIVTHRQVDSSEPVTTWAAALTISTTTPRTTVGTLPPWMSACLHAPFNVDLVVTGDIIHARDAAPLFQKQATIRNDEIEHHDEHNLRAGDSVYASYEEARVLADNFANGDAEAMVRYVGRLIVTGDSHREVMDRVRWLKNFYRDDLRITLVLAKDQVTALSELCPGVKAITRGFQRHAPVSMWAAGVPNVTGVIGQDNGMYLGYTSAPLAQRPVYFDPWWPASRDGQGAAIYPVLGDPGAGRSTLGLRVIQECILTGDYVVAIDPAGEWQNAVDLVGAEGRVRVLDLSADTLDTAGILSIPRLLPDPEYSAYDSDIAYEAAIQKVRHNRRTLAQDSLRQIVDDDTWSDPLRRNALKDAASQSDGDLWKAIDWLARPDETRHTDEETGEVTVTNPGGCEEHRRLAEELTSAAYGPARLMFPHRRPDGTTVAANYDGLLDSQVVIITMQGMQFPAPDSDRAHWDSAERGAALAMRMAAFLARRLIEVRPRRSRKVLIVDEASWLANWRYGADWIAAFVRHVRRWNTAVFLMTQHPNDLRRLDPEGNTFASGGFVGYTSQPEVAEVSLQIVRAAPGLGAVCKNLSWVNVPGKGRVKIPGEFIWVDAVGRVLRIRLDLGPFPVLAAVANTTPEDPEVEISEPVEEETDGFVVSLRKPHELVAGDYDYDDEEEPPDALAV